MNTSAVHTNGTLKKASAVVVSPPLNMTVTMAIMDVVVKIMRLTGVTVFCTDRAKAMAPRRPENHIMFRN